MFVALAFVACSGGPDVPAASWQQGEVRPYRMRMQSRLVRTSDPGQPLLGYQLSGDWTWTAIEVEPPTVLVHAVLENATVDTQARDPATAEALARVQSELSLPLLATFDDGGALRDVRFDPQISDFSVGVLEAALSMSQWVRPPTDATTWEVVETHADGRAKVRYTLADDGTGTREKVAYVSAEGDRDPPTIAASSGSFTVEGTRVVALETQETLTTDATTMLGTVEATTALSLEAKPVTYLDGDLAALGAELRALPALALDTPRGPSNDTSARDQAAWKGRSLEELRLQHAEGLVDANQEAQVDAFSGLVGLLRLRPMETDHVRDAISNGEADGRMLISALGYAGTPEAQRVLQGLFREFPTKELRDRALISLQRTTDPTPETLSLYESLLSEPESRPQALFGLGTAAMHLRDRRPAESDRVVGVLGRELTQATDPDAQVDVIRGLANAGGAAALPHLEPYLATDTVRVRLAAFDALHGIPGSPIDTRLAAAATTDASELVRRAAVGALRRRDPNGVVLKGLRDASRDEAYGVRVEAVRGLSRLALDDPSLVPDLQRIAASGDGDDIVALATEALQVLDDEGRTSP